MVRGEVDKRRKRNQFILTGSSVPDAASVKHSGAGRIAKVRMETMSLFESRDSSGSVSLRGLFNGGFLYSKAPQINIEQIASTIIRGGWPGSIVDGALPQPAAAPYLLSLGDRFSALNPSGANRMMGLLRSLARNDCTCVSTATLVRDVSAGRKIPTTAKTLERDLETLRRLYLFDEIPPFASHLRSSAIVRQAPKIRMFDPAISACLLDCPTPKSLMRDPNTMGLLFESLCLRDLRVYTRANGYGLYHYRDSRGQEIDAVVKDTNTGSWAGFEIKMNPDRVNEAAEKLVSIAKKLPAGKPLPTALAVITATGERAYKRDDGVYVIPIFSLRD